MKIIFTFDDGKKSQIAFWNKVQVPGTYFILPAHTELKTSFNERTDVDVCTWGEVRLLAKHNEIGFHGYSSRYEQWGPEKTKKMLDQYCEMFKENIGAVPVSFAYTNMQAYELPAVQPMFPYIRDYFWRDLQEDGSYAHRIEDKDVPEAMRPWRKRIFCMHPSKDDIHMLKRIRRARDEGYEYCVLIFHEIDDNLIHIGQIVGNAFDCVTFREVFEVKK